MNLFQVVNWKLEVKPEAFTIIAFRDLLDRDKSKDKKMAIKELSYVYYMCDSSSVFASYLDEEKRQEDVIKKVGLTNWKPDDKVKNAMRVYRELDETVTSRFLDSVKIALSKVDNYLRTFNEKDAESADIIRVNSMVEKSIDTVKSIRELEKLVLQDKETTDTLRGGRQRGFFMDDN